MFRASQTFIRSTWPAATRRVPQSSHPFAVVAYGQRPLALSSPATASVRALSSTGFRSESNKSNADRVIKPTPGGVSSESTTRKAFDGPIAPAYAGEDGHDMKSELKHDINVIRDTFKLSNIPRESHILGLAGTIPYFATSLSTLYLAWDLSTTLPTGNAIFDALYVNHDTARYLVDLIEPLQLGYGAVIISFLGAIHWGLEYAEKSPSLKRTRFRYGMGVAASIAAWPTLLLPLEYGLTAQFAAFVALYFADSNAARKGWAPRWYGQYRFLLTAMVGFAIFISLVGRTQIEKTERLSKGYLSSSMRRPGIADTETDWAKLEAEEKKKIKKEKEEKEKKAKQEEQKKKQNERAEAAGGGGKKAKKEDKKDDKDEEEDKSDEKEEKKEKKDDKPDEKKEKSKSDDKEGKDGDDKKDEKKEEK